MAPTILRRLDGSPRSSKRSVTTRSMAARTRWRAARSGSEQGKRSAGRSAAKERINKPKRARAADRSREEEEDTGCRSTGQQKALASDAAGQAAASSSSQASSAVSSPLRCPFVPRIVKGHKPDGTVIYQTNVDTAIASAYFKEEKKYCAKLDRQMKLTTLDPNVPLSCLSSDKLLAVRESVMKTVFQAAKFVVGLSSSIDEKPLARCSGFFVEWDIKVGVGFVLTSGSIICTKYPSIHDKSGKRQYASNAQVQVHLPNDITVDGELLHYDNHYHIALFEVAVGPSATLPSLSCDVKHSQDVFLLGRDENLYLTTNYGRVRYENPELFDPNYYMYVNCEVEKCDAGGLVISSDGRFVGMVYPTPRKVFIPASIILWCFHMWKKFMCIPRLHLGLKLSAIKCLEPSHIEKISSKFNIDEGFIVEEVSGGSNAEKVGIRTGDIITCWNEKKISTTIDLDNLLLGICEDHLSSANSIGSTVVVTVGVFCIRKESHCTKQLTVLVSDDVEVVATDDKSSTQLSCGFKKKKRDGESSEAILQWSGAFGV